MEARPDLAAEVSEPRVRAWGAWDLYAIRAAERWAESGDIRKAAELCEAMLGDDRIPAVFATRANALLGAPLSFEAGVGRKKRAAVKALEIEEDWWLALPENVLAQMLVWGRLLGVSSGQLKYDRYPDHGDRDIGVLDFWHPSHLRQDQDTKQWYTRVGGFGSFGGSEIGEIPIAAGDGKWFLFMPYGANRPWSMGLWRGLARLWLFKQFAIDDWGSHSEAHGNPIKAAFPPQTQPTAAAGGTSTKGGDGNRQRRKELAQDLANLASESSIVLPPGFDFKLVEATANTWEMFKAQIELANTAFAIAATGSNLPTEVTGSPGTGATAQTLVRLDYKKADAEVLSTATHDQWGVWWADLNYGDRALAPWASWEVEPKADLKARAEIVKTVAEAMAKFLEFGAPIDLPKLATEFELPEGPPQPIPAKPSVGAQRGLAALAVSKISDVGPALDAQAYLNRAADAGLEVGAKALEPVLVAVLRALDEADSYEELSARLPALAKALGRDPASAEFAAVVESVLRLGVGAGVWAVNEEAGGGGQ